MKCDRIIKSNNKLLGSLQYEHIFQRVTCTSTEDTQVLGFGLYLLLRPGVNVRTSPGVLLSFDLLSHSIIALGTDMQVEDLGPADEFAIVHKDA